MTADLDKALRRVELLRGLLEDVYYEPGLAAFFSADPRAVAWREKAGEVLLSFWRRVS